MVCQYNILLHLTFVYLEMNTFDLNFLFVCVFFLCTSCFYMVVFLGSHLVHVSKEYIKTINYDQKICSINDIIYAYL